MLHHLNQAYAGWANEGLDNWRGAANFLYGDLGMDSANLLERLNSHPLNQLEGKNEIQD